MSTTSRPNIEYAIFDMDGLLNRILGRYGHNMTWEIKAGIMGKREYPQSSTFPARPLTLTSAARPAAEYIFSHFPGLEEHLSVEGYMDESKDMQAEYFTNVEPMVGALALVNGLHRAGVPIAVASGSSLANFKIKTSHLSSLFSLFPPASILTADSPEVPPGRGKPFPDIYLAAARSLGRDVGTPDKCSDAQRAERERGIIFEDAVPGVRAGVAAGMNVVWVPDTHLRALAPDEDYGAKQVVTSLEAWDPTQWGLKAL